MFLGYHYDGFVGQKGGIGGTKGRVGLRNNSFRLEVRYKFVLRVVDVQLELQ